MDILNGTDTRTRINLGFTRKEFDDLCDALRDWANYYGAHTRQTPSKILRFDECITDEPTCDTVSAHVGPWEIGCSQPDGHAGPHNEERLTDTRTIP